MNLPGESRRPEYPRWVEVILDRIEQLERNLMATDADLQAAISSLQNDLQTLASSLTTAASNLANEISALDAKIAAGSVTQADLDGLKSADASVQAAAAQVADPSFGQPPPPAPA